MKSVLLVSSLVLLAVSAAAQNNGQAANGDFKFALAGAQGSIQFDARQQGNTARGQMTFNAAVAISNADVDGEGVSSAPTSMVSATVSFDCVRVSGNRAAMSGVVTASSVPALLGARAVLAVEDNGEGANAVPDRFTWGLYRRAAKSWTPSDAEVPGDNGAMLNWYASDAERPDDVPVLARQSEEVQCRTFPLGAYAFEDVARGAGNIQVKP